MGPDDRVTPSDDLKCFLSQIFIERDDILHTWFRTVVSNHKVDLSPQSSQEFDEYPIILLDQSIAG